MKEANESKHWRATGINTLVSILLFGGLLALMHGIEIGFSSGSPLLDFTSPVLYFSICSSVLGVAYILSIKNPENRTGFYLGIVSSFLLGIQFYLLGSYDLTFLYFAVFIPFQVKSITSWKKMAQGKETMQAKPSFLKKKRMWLSIFACCAIVVVDYAATSLWLAPETAPLLKLINGVLIASSVLANYLLIGKHIDSWIYWVVYSIDGILLSVFINNPFNTILFIFFLIINSITMISWIKSR